MSNFSYDQINTDYGFFGELRGSIFGLGKRDARTVFNAAVDALGEDPEKARQFLNSQSGRHLGDNLTFDLPSDPGVDDALKAVQRIKNDPQLKWVAKSYAKFTNYESANAEKVVGDLLNEDIR